MRLLVTGGGTGGHVYPAIAVAEYVRDQDPDSEVTFLGSSAGPEAAAAADAGIPYVGLDVSGLVGKRLATALRAIVMFTRATVRCFSLFRRFRPDCVLGTGGYASAPGCLTAVLARVPLVLHEMNYEPGLVTRLFAGRAKAVTVAYEGTGELLTARAKVVVTGVPVRREIAALGDAGVRAAAAADALRDYGLEPGRRTLFVFGGSQGAQAINEAVWAAVERLSGRADLQVLHMTGKNNFDKEARSTAEETAAKGELVYRAVPFIKRMDLALAVADLALSRAGAGTVAELVAAGLPAVLVPFPHATGGHQEKNARALAQAGAVTVVPQSGTFADEAVGFAIELLDDEGELAVMKEAARAAARPDGAKGIAKLLQELT